MASFEEEDQEQNVMSEEQRQELAAERSRRAVELGRAQDEAVEDAVMKIAAKDFEFAAREVMFHAVKLRDPMDRLNACQWIRKLSQFGNEKESHQLNAIEANNYMQYFKQSLAGQYKVLTKPFCFKPPEHIVPFAECLGNLMHAAIPDLPRSGKIQPTICHRSDDSRAWMCVKKTQENDIYCYLAVSQEPLKFNPENIVQ